MEDRKHGEKEEEKQEKEHEKEEKSWDEKWRRDPLSAIVWAAILIWVGVALLLDNLGVLTRLEPLSTWGLIFIGAGVIVLLEVAVRLLIAEYRRPVVGTAIFGIVLLAIGLGNLTNWAIVGPIILIAIGAAILLGGFRRRR
jgi:hypothetical protein